MSSIPNTSALKRLKEQFDLANQRNEDRLQNIMGLLEGSDAQIVEDVKRGGREERAETLQQLISQGLAGGTRLQALFGRSREREEREVSRIRQDTARQKAGVLERVSDVGPDIPGAANLVAQAAEGNAAARRSHTTVGGGFGGGSPGGGGSGGSGGSAFGGYGARSSASGVQTHTNPGAGHTSTRNRPCGYIKTWGCTLPDGSTWPHGDHAVYGKRQTGSYVGPTPSQPKPDSTVRRSS